jgi:hypothetical protein
MLMWMVLVVACGNDLDGVQDDSASGPGFDGLDLREAYPDPPPGGFQIMAPDLEVGPYEETFFCYFGTYLGPTVGVNYMAPLQVDAFNHHNLLKAVLDGEFEDGVLIECPSQEVMPEFFPLFEGVGEALDHYTEGGQVEPSIEGQGFGITAPEYPIPMGDSMNWIHLPGGVAIRLDSGQPWVLDTHYINTMPEAILVNSGTNLGIIPEEEVEYWASTLHHDAGALIQLPPGESTSVSFDCEWDHEINLLSITGHMHEHGTSYKIEWIHGDGSEPDVLYELDPWKEEYRDQPVMKNWDEGEIQAQAGDSFRTTCTWFNSTDHLLQNPDEMCSTGGVAFPLDEPHACSEGQVF